MTFPLFCRAESRTPIQGPTQNPKGAKACTFVSYLVASAAKYAKMGWGRVQSRQGMIGTPILGF